MLGGYRLDKQLAPDIADPLTLIFARDAGSDVHQRLNPNRHRRAGRNNELACHVITLQTRTMMSWYALHLRVGCIE